MSQAITKRWEERTWNSVMKTYKVGDTPYSIHITFPGRERDDKNWDEMILTILVSSWFR